MKRIISTMCFLVVVLVLQMSFAQAQTTAFTYQGKLTDGGVAASGQYDLTFRLYDLASGGTQIGPDVVRDNVQVTAGVFTVDLDFGSSPFTTTTANHIEISVRPGVSTGTFTMLTPRQPLTSSPYAVQTIRAASAAVADNAVQLGGVNADQFVQTGDARLSDARSPLPGSPNYIQNGTSPQATSNFNVSGTGTANIFSATTQYNIGGSRVLSIAGTNNVFAGVGAGTATSNASNNAFFGSDSGRSNSDGNNNAFFGRLAGDENTSGSGNTFVGFAAGFSNTTGINNTLIGNASIVGTGNLSFATALGAGTIVQASNTVVLGRPSDAVQVPGALNVTGPITGTVSNATTAANATNAVNATNAATATNALQLGGVAANQFVQTGDARLSDARSPLSGSTNYIQNQNGASQATSNFNVSGTGTANILNATTQYNIGGNRVFTASIFNTIAGVNAGLSNPTGSGNSFFGTNAGEVNTTGVNNSFFGIFTGVNNTTGSGNAFFGRSAGLNNTTASNNAFFGTQTGQFNELGQFNAFFGGAAGFANTMGNNNAFFGVLAGRTNSSGSNNTLIGTSANVSVGNLSNATAVGANALVSQSNSLVLGSINGVNSATADTNVGIGTTAPVFKLHVVDTLNTALRVQTSIAGGTVASFGGFGDLQVDAPGVAGGRFIVKESGNVGVGTNAPNAKLQVAGGSVYIQQPNSLIITSPNGACWFITVGNTGVLSTISVTCP